MRYAIIVYKNDAKAASLAESTALMLREAGLETWQESSGPEARSPLLPGFTPDLIISLGGDGTLLYAARTWGLTGTPLLGVNLGHLGFLADTEPENLENILRCILKGHFQVEPRFALEVSIEREAQLMATVTVLNDAVINKGALARIMQMHINVKGFGHWDYRADGLIMATPTGSTAYNLSAGGPVVHPTLPAVIITPICPFTLSSRPLILPSDLQIEVTLDAKATDAHLTGDGQMSQPLYPGDRLIARRSESGINLVVNPHHRFSNSLHQKLGWR